MIYEHISDDIPPQMEILNMVIPILMHFYYFVSNLSNLNRNIIHVIDDIKLFQTVYRRIYCCILPDILSQIFDVIQSDIALQNQVH